MNIPLGGDNAFFLDLYSRYRKDRNSVPADWALHFEELQSGETGGPSAPRGVLCERLLDAYRRYGHFEAKLDPLADAGQPHPVLDRLRAGLAAADVGEVSVGFGGATRRMPLPEAEALMRSVYSQSVGLEVEHLDDENARAWWYEAFERSFLSRPAEEARFQALESIILADEFESFMRVKFPTKKRFGIEGAESAIVFLREILDAAPERGVEEIVCGGMHRGRLAMLAVAFGKSPATLAAELMGRDLSEGAIFTGDVPYHLGYTSAVQINAQRRLKLTLLPHPSHLLVVAPVALGLARATARRPGHAPETTLCLLLHTDAAFSGQGLACEILQLGGIEGYSVCGAIHLVVNNQIGFTTLPSEGRSSRYCTDLGKAVGAPVLHVNADDPVAVARVAQLALAWREAFRRDILVDLVCYRRNGHNELDEPRFTQPGMWSSIDSHPTVREQFSACVLAEHPRLAARAAQVAGDFRARLQSGFEVAAAVMPNDEPVQAEPWAAVSPAAEADLLEAVSTGIDIGRLRAIGLAASEIPPEVSAHPKVRQFYEARAASIRNGAGINFATAEALAFAALLAEGTRVRLSGQDSVRGTFTQRHLVVHDVVTGEACLPLAQVASGDGALEVLNSPLSEYGVLGFEYGHSLFDPEQLTLWEAQFGDFMNGAQVVVDQYIVAAEAKWKLRSGLVVMLPHGLEGQGPDHSSARIERLSQLCAGANMILAQPTTPANLFHLLRRQIAAPWRKPLFLIAPKSMLRAKAAVSTLAEMGAGAAFRPVIAEHAKTPERVRRLVLCSGKVFYALDQMRREHGLAESIVPIRVEQIYPFPAAALRAAIAPFPAADIVWLQEEPANQGPWPYVSQRLSEGGIRLSAQFPLLARPAMSVTAGGSVERHDREQKEILERVLQLDAP